MRGPAAYEVEIQARDAWLGLVPGHRAVFDPDAGAPAFGELAAMVSRNDPGRPRIVRLTLADRRPLHWEKPGKPAFGVYIDTEGGIRGCFERAILRVDKFIGIAT
jgi:hypothetical protein